MNFQDVYKKIAEDISYLFTNMADALNYDKTFRAKVIRKESNGKYSVLYKNKEYAAKCDGSLNRNDTVWVCAPKNDWNELYVQSCNSLRKKITLADTGVFHITRQMVIENNDYYTIAITITPTLTPVTDTPILTFPKNLSPCVLQFYAGSANGILYSGNNNQLNYRLLSGSVNNTTEIIINGNVPKA